MIVGISHIFLVRTERPHPRRWYKIYKDGVCIRGTVLRGQKKLTRLSDCGAITPTAKAPPGVYAYRIREGDQFGFYKHLKGMDVEGKRTFDSQYIKDEEGRLLRDNALIRERWVRWFHKLLNTKSPTLDPSIVGELTKQWPPCRPLDDVPSR